MRKRSEKAIRYHKFNKMKNPHKWHFSKLLLYLPFQNEEDLYDDDFEKCLSLYLEKFELLSSIKKQVMPHLDHVVEAREKAEEFLSEIGDVMDSNRERDDDEAAEEGPSEHPELAIKESTTNDLTMDGILGNTTFR